jgi:2-phospho-L-lactate/phosphoenolpyruvate guanylyltransferase
MKTLAILPVKTFGAAKQRLSPALPEAERRSLAEAMVRDVLAALVRVSAVDAIAVVTADESARAIAVAAGAEVLEDTARDGQSPAALIGVGHALAGGFSRALLVPGDTPLLDPDEVDALLARARSAPCVTIVPDRHGTGTNALLLGPPDAIAPSFGPGSFERHRQAAESAGASVLVDKVPSLVLDVDTGHDLSRLVEALHGRPGAAPATRGALAPHRVSA